MGFRGRHPPLRLCENHLTSHEPIEPLTHAYFENRYRHTMYETHDFAIDRTAHSAKWMSWSVGPPLLQPHFANPSAAS